MSHARSQNNNRYTSCIGIEDGPFFSRRLGNSQAPLVAVQFDGPHLRKIYTGPITVDGLNATKIAVEILSHFEIGKAPILLGGVTFAGFNLIDPNVLHKRFRTPVLVVTGARPDNRAVKSALKKHFADWKHRWHIIGSLGPLRKAHVLPEENPLFYEAVGCTAIEANRILKSWAYVSRTPEPLRVAAMIARGLYSSKPNA